MIVVTVFYLVMNPTEFHWVHDQKENCHCDLYPLNLKVIRKNIYLSVQKIDTMTDCLSCALLAPSFVCQFAASEMAPVSVELVSILCGVIAKGSPRGSRTLIYTDHSNSYIY